MKAPDQEDEHYKQLLEKKPARQPLKTKGEPRSAHPLKSQDQYYNDDGNNANAVLVTKPLADCQPKLGIHIYTLGC